MCLTVASPLRIAVVGGSMRRYAGWKLFLGNVSVCYPNWFHTSTLTRTTRRPFARLPPPHLLKPEFKRNDTETIISEFERLTIQKGWTKKSKIQKERKKFIGKAVVEDFGKEFGTNAGSLRSWQSLCKRLRLLSDDDELPESIQQCKTVCVHLSGLRDLTSSAEGSLYDGILFAHRCSKAHMSILSTSLTHAEQMKLWKSSVLVKSSPSTSY